MHLAFGLALCASVGLSAPIEDTGLQGQNQTLHSKRNAFIQHVLAKAAQSYDTVVEPIEKGVESEIKHGQSMIEQNQKVSANIDAKAEKTAVGEASEETPLPPFNLMKCIMDFKKNTADAKAKGDTCAKYAFSCNNFWAGEVSQELTTGMFCFINAYERNTPKAAYDASKAGYSNFLHTVVSPGWDALMKANALKGADGGKSYVQVKDECSAISEWGGKLKCMAKQIKTMKGVKPDFSLLAKDEKQMASLRETVTGLMRGMEFAQKAAEIEQAPSDASDLSSLDFTEADDVPIPGPLESALDPGEPRYASTQPGLAMKGSYLTEVDPKAVCNDGSPSIAYVAEGTLPGKFHLHLGGGYFCYNARNCRKRTRTSPQLSSSKGHEMDFVGTGIFDPYHGGLKDFTHATFTFCSSDAFFGQVDIADFQVINNTFIRPGQTGTFFRGYTMIDAMLDLFVIQGLGSVDGGELVMSGCSAGSIAVTAQADSFVTRVQQIHQRKQVQGSATFYPPKVTVVCDNAPIVSPKPIIKNFNGVLPLFQQSQELVKHLYVNPGINPTFLNAGCVEAHKGGLGAGACVFPEQVMPYIRTPNLVLNNLWDTFILFNPAAFFQPTTPEQEDFAKYAIKIQKVTLKKVSKDQNMWAIGCNDHCFTLAAFWWRLTCASALGKNRAGTDYFALSPKDAFDMTRAGDLGHNIMDECETYNCGCMQEALFYNMFGTGQLLNQISINKKAAKKE